jgi:NTE family protein
MLADGVFSGGGIKGLAFAGALEATAQAGYDEWGQVAGTSAGAITAMALAVGYNAQQLREQLDSFDFSEIADYGPLGEVEIPVNLAEHMGVTKGVALLKWIEKLLAEAPHPATTFGELEEGKLQVVGTDLAHSRMVVFPRDVGLYVGKDGERFDPKTFPIATAVRISAGFPYFFPPLKLRDAETGKDGILVDGGVTSAFPIFLFDTPKPKHPTWGYRLYSGDPPEKPAYTAIGGLTWPVEMLEAIVDTSINALDQFEMPSFKDRTISIPTGDIPTLDFELTEKQKKELYDFGFETAKAFFKANPDGRNSFGAVPASLAPQ